MLADAPQAWQWEAAVTHRTLVERDASGARLLRENGPMARARVVAPAVATPLGRIDFSAALAYGRLDYDGRTQAGGSLATRSHHYEAEGGARWRPMQAQAWGEISLSLDALWFRRDIAATAGTSALRETSVAWLPGFRWDGPQWQLGNVPVSAHARWRTSANHRLRIDYSGLFDPSSLRGGRRTDIAVGVAAALPADWSASIDWQRTRQQASRVVPIYRSGVAAGTVFQPRIAIDDVSLTLAKRF